MSTSTVPTVAVQTIARITPAEKDVVAQPTRIDEASTTAAHAATAITSLPRLNPVVGELWVVRPSIDLPAIHVRRPARSSFAAVRVRRSRSFRSARLKGSSSRMKSVAALFRQDTDVGS